MDLSNPFNLASPLYWTLFDDSASAPQSVTPPPDAIDQFVFMLAIVVAASVFLVVVGSILLLIDAFWHRGK